MSWIIVSRKIGSGQLEGSYDCRALGPFETKDEAYAAAGEIRPTGPYAIEPRIVELESPHVRERALARERDEHREDALLAVQRAADTNRLLRIRDGALQDARRAFELAREGRKQAEAEADRLRAQLEAFQTLRAGRSEWENAKRAAGQNLAAWEGLACGWLVRAEMAERALADNKR